MSEQRTYTIFSIREQEEILEALRPLLKEEADAEFRPGIRWIVGHMEWLQQEGLFRAPLEGVSRYLRRDQFPTSRRP